MQADHDRSFEPQERDKSMKVICLSHKFFFYICRHKVLREHHCGNGEQTCFQKGRKIPQLARRVCLCKKSRRAFFFWRLALSKKERVCDMQTWLDVFQVIEQSVDQCEAFDCLFVCNCRRMSV